MKNPEYKDKLSEYSAADRAIMQSSLNAARLANKKGAVKKTATKNRGMNAGYANEAERAKAMKSAKKKAASKSTDSRFTGLGAGKPKPSGTGGYTPGSAKSNKATYTTGSGVRYTSAAKKATPAQKTKSLKKNPVVRFVTSRVGGKSGGYGNSK